MVAFQLFNIPIRIQGMFWLLCLFIGMNYLQAGGSKGIGMFLIFGVSLFATVLWHELGHAWARKKNGAPHSEIVLHGFGGYCAGPGTFSRPQSIFISAAGPLANFVLAAAAFLLMHLPGTEGFWPRFALSTLITINLFLGILNLLPIFPMDGGQILANILGPKHTRTVFIIGLGLGGILAAFFLMTGNIFGGVIFGMLAFQNWKGMQGQRPSFP
ncbi:M50 family metallopeptidase [Verrucomicrobiales bacterium BCK34]|nr:M50 family metallopeptidase [Verrucomicrobiales bacterium BCK34]